MPTVFTHAAVGAGLVAVAPLAHRPPILYVAAAGVAVLPDVDVVAYVAGVPWGSMWAHRGISHSLPAAAVVGAVAALGLAGRVRAPWAALAACLALATASHGVLDAFTSGGSGIAFLAPFDDTRYFFPWRPVEVSPIGRGFFSARGLRVLDSELRWICLPLAVVVVLARLGRRARRAGRRRPVE